MTKPEIFDSYNQYILSTYTRLPVIFVKGKGSVLTDIDGKKYLDFFPGWGVSNLGHCHPKVMSGVRDQIGKLIHIPNNLYHPQQAKLAKEIIRRSFPGKIFFSNSGAEAVEAAIKIARAFGKGERHEIITTQNSFHGRTLGALAATGQKKHQDGFAPLPEGFRQVPFNDLDALKSAVTPKTVAVMIELVQGEGGIHVARQEYVEGIRKICDEKKILLIFDEIQTGLGRVGEIFGFKHYGVIPDIMTLAKALGGGLPIGATVVHQEFTDVLKPGMHGSTFAGSPLVCKAALGVFKGIDGDKVIRNVKNLGPYLMEQLKALQKKYPVIKEVRGLGMMFGIELSVEGKAIVENCLQHGLIINCTQGNVLRLMPALNVTKKQIDKALFILEKAVKGESSEEESLS